ncbi:hypothetical protein CRYUN_Cryun22dG0044500 [Craigia yunnanensis]
MERVGGEIVQVQGGHIVRSTGRKDRHSKVYTVKGPRDRRVRLSAYTAIQFYDVQDRLGYDRPSKAVDWLIKKAKPAIDKLAELPPWHPNANTNTTVETDEPNAFSSKMAIAEQSESSGYNYQLRQLGDNPNNDSSFVVQQLESTAIGNTNSFFPTSTNASSINLPSYPPELISRTTNPTDDLGLSLHSFQDPGLIRGHCQGETSHTPSTDQNFFAGSAQVVFHTNFQRMVAWSRNTCAENRDAGFVFNSLPFAQQQSLLCQGSTLSQRGPLQSSFSESIRAWNDLPIASTDHYKTQEIHQASIFGSRFASDELPGFSNVARIPGEDEHSSVSDRPSSSSPNSHC